MHRLIKSIGWAANGLHATWREEVNFRIELLASFGVIMLAKYFHFTPTEWMIILGCIGAVLAAEIVNTAIEDLCDRVVTTHDPMIGKIKDIMAGFVLLVCVTAGVIGLIIFSHYF